MVLKSSFIFTLSEEIEYPDTTDGTVKKTKKIKLLGPNQNEECKNLYINLRSKISHALFLHAKSSPSSDVKVENKVKQSQELDSATMIALLEATDILVDFLPLFKNYLLNGIALVDGKITLIKSVYDKIAIEDICNMIGEYTINFLLNPLFKGTDK